MNLQYVLYVIRFYKDMLRNSKKGAAIPHLNKQLFYNIIVGLPPIEEQARIVEKVNQVFQLSDWNNVLIRWTIRICSFVGGNGT